MENEVNPAVNADEQVNETSNQEQAENNQDFEAIKAEKERLESELGSLKREFKDFKKSQKADESKTDKNTDELDYGQMAFLEQKGVDTSNEEQLNLVKRMLNVSDNLQGVVRDDIFQAKLSELKEVQKTANAVPEGTRRSGQPAVDSVDYWLAKYKETGELPPKENVEMRRKVVNARMSTNVNSNDKFTDNPIVS